MLYLYIFSTTPLLSEAILSSKNGSFKIYIYDMKRAARGSEDLDRGMDGWPEKYYVIVVVGLAYFISIYLKVFKAKIPAT